MKQRQGYYLTNRTLLLFFTYLFIIAAALMLNKAGLYRGVVICTFVSLTVFIVSRRKAFNLPSTFMTVFLYVYNCGQVWLIFFSRNLSLGSFLVTRFEDQLIYAATTYFIVCVCIFQMFITLFSSKFEAKTRLEIEDRFEFQPNIKYAAIICYILCLIALLFHDYMQISSALIRAYSTSARLGRNNSLIYIAINIYPLLASILMLSLKGWGRKAVFIHLIGRSMLMMLIVGNRGQYTALLCIGYLLYFNQLRDPNKKVRRNRFGTIVLAIFIIIIAGYVASIRNLVQKNYSIVEYLVNHNIISEVFQELGGTLINTILVFKNCPQEIPFGKGISYLGGLIQFVPLLNRAFPKLVYYNDLGAILNGYFERYSTSGLGGSIIAEWYFNFAWFGTLVVPIYSFVMTKLDDIVRDRARSLFSTAIGFYYTYVMFMYARSNFSDLAYYTRFLVYFWAISLLFGSGRKIRSSVKWNYDRTAQ